MNFDVDPHEYEVVDGEPFEHEEETTCPCEPRVVFENGEMLVVHNSFDGREAVEWADSIINHEDQ